VPEECWDASQEDCPRKESGVLRVPLPWQIAFHLSLFTYHLSPLPPWILRLPPV
jgi:hypothetical protein